MAQTGRVVAITPADRNAGIPRCKAWVEASVQTYLKGAPLVKNASGYVAEGASIPQVLWGFARVAGQNGASDGAKTASAYVAEVGKTFTGTLAGTLATSHAGASAMLSQSASSWVLTIVTSASASYNAKIDSWTSSWAVGDVNAEVIFTLIDTKIQTDA